MKFDLIGDVLAGDGDQAARQGVEAPGEEGLGEDGIALVVVAVAIDGVPVDAGGEVVIGDGGGVEMDAGGAQRPQGSRHQGGDGCDRIHAHVRRMGMT